MWFVYILECEDGNLYTGITNDLEKRFIDHKDGNGGKYTRSHKPVKFVYQEQLPSRAHALKREFEIKSWSRERKIKTFHLSNK